MVTLIDLLLSKKIDFFVGMNYIEFAEEEDLEYFICINRSDIEKIADDTVSKGQGWRNKLSIDKSTSKGFKLCPDNYNKLIKELKEYDILDFKKKSNIFTKVLQNADGCIFELKKQNK